MKPVGVVCCVCRLRRTIRLLWRLFQGAVGLLLISVVVRRGARGRFISTDLAIVIMLARIVARHLGSVPEVQPVAERVHSDTTADQSIGEAPLLGAIFVEIQAVRRADPFIEATTPLPSNAPRDRPRPPNPCRRPAPAVPAPPPASPPAEPL